jgi:hypothetical protein
MLSVSVFISQGTQRSPVDRKMRRPFEHFAAVEDSVLWLDSG